MPNLKPRSGSNCLTVCASLVPCAIGLLEIGGRCRISRDLRAPFNRCRRLREHKAVVALTVYGYLAGVHPPETQRVLDGVSLFFARIARVENKKLAWANLSQIDGEWQFSLWFSRA